MLAEPLDLLQARKDHETSLLSIIATIEKASKELEAFVKLDQLSVLLAPAQPLLLGTKRQTYAPLQQACDRMMDLIADPHEVLMNIAYSHHSEAALRYVADHDIAGSIPADGSPVSFPTLATNIDASQQHCTRILRLLMTYNIFREPMTGYVCHTPASLLLLDPDNIAYIKYQTDDSFRASGCLTKALDRWPDSAEPNQTAFSLVHDTDLSMFGYYNQEPEKLFRFRRAMTGMARRKQFDVSHLVNGYPWEHVPTGATVADVGGASGHASLALPARDPNLRIMVQDLGISADQKHANASTAIEFMQYDFFQSQPVQADIYLFRWILHDWSDKYATEILRNQLPAMRPGSRLLIMDGIMPDVGKATRTRERASRTLDLAMLTLFNSYERELKDWEMLFKSVDSRLSLSKVYHPEGSALSIMEVVFDG